MSDLFVEDKGGGGGGGGGPDLVCVECSFVDD